MGNIDSHIKRLRTGAYGGIIATIPAEKVKQARREFGPGFPTKGTPRGSDVDFNFKSNSAGYEKLWRNTKKAFDF